MTRLPKVNIVILQVAVISWATNSSVRSNLNSPWPFKCVSANVYLSTHSRCIYTKHDPHVIPTVQWRRAGKFKNIIWAEGWGRLTTFSYTKSNTKWAEGAWNRCCELEKTFNQAILVQEGMDLYVVVIKFLSKSCWELLDDPVYYVILTIILVITTLTIIFHTQIVNWLTPATRWLHGYSSFMHW